MSRPTPKNPVVYSRFLTAIIFGTLSLLVIFALLFWNKESADIPELPRDNIDVSVVDWSTYPEKSIYLSDSLKITSPGVYKLSGTLRDGMIKINTFGTVKLILNGVSITNSNGPAIYVASASTVFIETAPNTTNFLTDSSIYNGWNEDVNATVFSKSDLVLRGSGTLVINGNFNDGVASKDNLKVLSGIYEINTRDDGLRGRDSVYILDGEFEFSVDGDAIKSTNSDEPDKGWIRIDDGSFFISASDDGFRAASSLEVNGGTIFVNGVNYDIIAPRTRSSAG